MWNIHFWCQVSFKMHHHKFFYWLAVANGIRPCRWPRAHSRGWGPHPYQARIAPIRNFGGPLERQKVGSKESMATPFLTKSQGRNHSKINGADKLIGGAIPQRGAIAWEGAPWLNPPPSGGLSQLRHCGGDICYNPLLTKQPIGVSCRFDKVLWTKLHP